MYSIARVQLYSYIEKAHEDLGFSTGMYYHWGHLFMLAVKTFNYNGQMLPSAVYPAGNQQ